jgi:hypothetical protein
MACILQSMEEATSGLQVARAVRPPTLEARRNMHRQPILRSVLFVGVLSAAMAAGACQRQEPDAGVPPPTIQSQGLHQTDRPMTVSGCLKAGEAENTFVLTAAQADGGGETATYQLVTRPDVNLRDQVGQMLQVSGTLQAQQSATAQTVAEPAETREDQPAGTTGTPKVQTRTDVTINQLTVDSVTALGEECGIGT